MLKGKKYLAMSGFFRIFALQFRLKEIIILTIKRKKEL